MRRHVVEHKRTTSANPSRRSGLASLTAYDALAMLDLKYIRNHPEEIRQLCVRRQAPLDVDQLLAQDERVRSLTQQIESLRQKRNVGAESRESAIALREKIA